MAGSIDPGARQSVGSIGRTQVVWLIGARVAETILASGSNKQAGHMDASDPPILSFNFRVLMVGAAGFEPATPIPDGRT